MTEAQTGESMQNLEEKTTKDRYDYDASEDRFLMGFSDLNGIPIGRVVQCPIGFEVLNTTTMLFADIDIGNPQGEEGCLIDSEDDAIAALRQVAEPTILPSKPTPLEAIDYFFRCDRGSVASQVIYWASQLDASIGFRVYRTRGGLRVMCATHRLFPQDCDDLLRFIYSDPRYRVLCKNQGRFGARITPKPWRVVGQEARVCEFVETVGSTDILPEFERMVSFHDSATGVFKKGGYLA